jgi:hypothetical protein
MRPPAIAGRDAILTMKDGVLKFATADGDEIFPGTDVTAPYFTTRIELTAATPITAVHIPAQ